MKKIININLAGRVIPIEDAAYEALQRYIESLRRYFAAEEGRDEIINDIESRIAELMNDKVRRGQDAVTESDIEEIINTMGRVEDFAQADATDNTTSSTGQTFSNAQSATSDAGTSTGWRFRGRLYRNANDKILGGVCSGLASYMNVDPAIVRLLFAIITFGGFGFGIFLYILAWIILPARSLEGYVGKRLFRNPEDRILGGVAGGLGAYFGKEPWIFRLIFAGPLALNILFGILNGVFFAFHRDVFPNFFIGSFTGTFILIYIVLWIVLPEARSPFERMEMRGEKVDVNRIWQNVQQNMSDIGTRAQAWGEEVRQSAEQWGNRASQFAGTRARTFSTEVSQSGRSFGRSVGHVIGMLFKAFFLFVFGVIAFALFVMVVVFTTGGLAQPVNDFLLDGTSQKLFLWGTLLFFLAVPLIAIITWIVRRLMKVRSQNRYLGWTFGGLWTLGWICLMLFIASMAKDFRTYDRVPQQVVLAQSRMNKMIVRVDEPRIRYSGTFGWINDDGDNNGGWDLTEDTLRMSNVKLRVRKSPDSAYHVTVWKYSRGENRNEAATRAEKLSYTVSSQDSALILGSGFGVGKAQKFRAQGIMVEINVPVGKQIRFDESIEQKLDFTNVRVFENRRWEGTYRNWNRHDWDEDWNGDSYYDWQPNVDYTMTESGDLVDLAHPAPPKNNGVYEYNNDSAAAALDSQEQRQRQREEQTQDLQRQREEQIEKQRQKVEEENRKLQELQDNQNNDKQRTGQLNNGTLKKTSLETTSIHTPIFSLLM